MLCRLVPYSNGSTRSNVTATLITFVETPQLRKTLICLDWSKESTRDWNVSSIEGASKQKCAPIVSLIMYGDQQNSKDQDEMLLKQLIDDHYDSLDKLLRKIPSEASQELVNDQTEISRATPIFPVILVREYNWLVYIATGNTRSNVGFNKSTMLTLSTNVVVEAVFCRGVWVLSS